MICSRKEVIKNEEWKMNIILIMILKNTKMGEEGRLEGRKKDARMKYF